MIAAMRTLAGFAVLIAVWFPAVPAQAAQESPAPRSFQSLRELAQVRGVQRVRQLRIATAEPETPGQAPAVPAPQDRPLSLDPDATGPELALLEDRVVPGSLRRERRPQLSDDRLVVVVEDAAGRDLDWRIVPNPAIVRAEAPGPDGQLQGRTIEINPVELSIAIPDIAGADRVSLYRPRWTGTEYLLVPFGQVQLGR